MNDLTVPIAPELLTGVFHGLDASAYHRVEAMSASGAKKMLRSPQHYKLMRDTPSEPTPQMQFGTVVHAGVLEPDTFDSVVAIAPLLDKRTKDGKERWQAFSAANAGKIILSPDDWSRAEHCINAVRESKAASALLTGAVVEVSVFWRDGEYGVPCKARYDATNHGGLIDLKTTQDASPEAFARSCAAFSYHAQGAHYWSGYEHQFDRSPEFFALIAVETEPPYAVACYALPAVALQAGRRLMDEALARYRDALAAGKWPGYPEKILPLELPRWALRNSI